MRNTSLYTVALGVGLTAVAQAQYPPAPGYAPPPAPGYQVPAPGYAPPPAPGAPEPSADQGPVPQVVINGNPLRTSVAPIIQNGRLLVPLRDIFERLGARVEFDNLSQTISAERGTTVIRMTLGSTNVTVNNLPYTLDVPAQSYYGRTLVPLRFVSQALGAQVYYDNVQLVATIVDPQADQYWHAAHDHDHDHMAPPMAPAPMMAPPQAPPMYHQIDVAQDTVVPVWLQQDLSSATAVPGQVFLTSVVSSREGDSEFPPHTRIEGVVNDVQPRHGQDPGVLTISFDAVIFPDGKRIPINGQAIGLDSDSVINDHGHLVPSEGARTHHDTLKFVGIGAAGGFLLGKVVNRKDGGIGALLGAAGGLLLSQNQKPRGNDVFLAHGTKIGVRLFQPVTYQDNYNYYGERSHYVNF